MNKDNKEIHNNLKYVGSPLDSGINRLIGYMSTLISEI